MKGDTVKIIIKGKKPETRLFEGKCHACNSVMQEKSGKLKVESDMREGGQFAHARCPVCGRDFIMIPLKDVDKKE